MSKTDLSALDGRAEAGACTTDNTPTCFETDGYRFYVQSSMTMPQCMDDNIALTITSPPYWNAIDYDLHANEGDAVWHRQRHYAGLGGTYKKWLSNIIKVFAEVYRITMDGGFCAVVIGTILHRGKHYPAPFDLVAEMGKCGWRFHQDIVWNKVTGGVKRAGVFIQHPQAGYYYPNIMTEYILVFKKGERTRRDSKKAIPIDELFKRDIANNIWHIAPIPPRTIAHPCPYPDELVRRLVLLYSQEEDVLLDPFLGSGQSAIGAVRHGRRIVGYDIEPAYVRLSIERLNNPAPPRKYHLVTNFRKITA